MQLRLSELPQFEPTGQPPLRLAQRDAALLAWLAIEGPTPRARVAQLLWPDHDDDAARNSLRQRLFQLRRQTGAELVSGSTTLALTEGVLHDLAPDSALLGGATLGIGDEFDAWLARQRERRRGLKRQAREERLRCAEAEGDYRAALVVALDWLGQEPQLEEAHRLVMRLHYLLGDRAAARQAFVRCEQVLSEAMGVTPGAETQALRAMIERDQPTPAPAPAAGALVPAGVLRPPRLVGRETETAAVHAAWERAQVVALIGEAGMGKTRLLQHLLPTSDAGPGSTLRISARPGDAGVPLATLARLLRAVAERGDPVLAPAARREIGRVLPEWAPGALPAAEGQRLVLQRAVQELLAQQASLQVVALDDLHFADPASLQLLQALLDEPATHLHWVLAYRPAEAGSALLALHEGLLEHARAQAVALSPLGINDLAALVDSLGLPGIDGATLAPGLWRRTGGNPLFVLETLKQAWVERRLAALADERSLPRPLSVVRLIERRLLQLSPTALALARCAAVAGQQFSAGLASRVLGHSALALADAWAELEAAQILRDQVFVHDLFFEAALASVPAAISRHLHGEIAAYLEGLGAAEAVAPATLAWHWLAAGRSANAAAPLERAAQAAALALDPVEAARLWRQLSELRRSAGAADAAFDAARSEVLALRSLTNQADLVAAIDRMDTLVRTNSQQADVHELRAAMFHARGQPLEAAASVALGLAALGPDAPAPARVNQLNKHGVLLRHGGQLQSARSALEQALALARSGAAPEADLPALLNNLGLVHQAQDEHAQAIALMQESAERQSDPLVRARVLNNLAISLEERGQSALAREQRLAAARSAQGAGGMVELNLAISLGANARQLGRYRVALAHLAQAQAVLAGQPHLREEDLLRQTAAVWIELGRLNLARETLDHALRVASGSGAQALVEIMRARLALALGQPQQAQVSIEAAEARLRSGDQRVLRRLWLVKARLLEPAAALTLLQEVAALPALRDNVAAALPVHSLLAQTLLRLQQPALALQHAQRAAHWLQAVWPLEMSPAEVQLTLARCAQACTDTALAQQAAAQGMDWVQRVALEHLDEIYRDGWLERNAVNRELAQFAAQLGCATA